MILRLIRDSTYLCPIPIQIFDPLLQYYRIERVQHLTYINMYALTITIMVISAQTKLSAD